MSIKFYFRDDSKINPKEIRLIFRALGEEFKSIIYNEEIGYVATCPRKENDPSELLVRSRLIEIKDNNLKEMWVNLAFMNYPNYWVSSEGRLKTRYGKICEPGIIPSGYVFVTLSNNGKDIRIHLHVVVAIAFKGDGREDGLCVDHINRIRSDNRVINLRWVTMKGQCENKKPRDKDTGRHREIIQLSMEGEFIAKWHSAMAASKELKIDRPTIARVCQGHGISCGNFKWQFADNYYGSEEDEQWVDIELDDEAISISDIGRVKLPSGTISFGYENSDGYRDIRIHGRNYKVHRLVAFAFLDFDLQSKLDVHHIDHDRKNNRKDNLRALSRKEHAWKQIIILQRQTGRVMSAQFNN